MADRRRMGSLLLLGTITVFWVVGLAAPAGAEVLQGGCTGSVEFSDGTKATESTPLTDVVIVPPEDSVVYQGSINLPPPDDAVPFNGDVSVRLPRFNWAVVSWDDTTKEVSAGGTHAYEIPGFVPQGVQLEVSASHTQMGQTCVVAVTMKLDGDPGPVAIIAAAGTLVFAAGTFGAGIRKKVAS